VTGAGFAAAALFGTKIHVFSIDPVQDEVRIRQSLLSDGIDVHAIAVRPLSLDDVFVQRLMALEQQGRATTKGVAA
jgi:ABC-2 type transport system ATP-binding protein